MQNEALVLEAYLRNKLEHSESLPLYQGHVSLRGVAREAVIAYDALKNSSELRAQVSQAYQKVDEYTRLLHRQQVAVPGHTASPLLYQELLAAADGLLERHRLSPPSWPAYLSALRTFMRSLSRTPKDPVGADFTQNFELHLAAYLDARHSHSPQGRAIATSRLHFWQSEVQNFLLDTALPRSFGDALRALVDRQQHTLAQLAKTTGIDDSRLQQWATGKTLPSSPQEVHTLEQALEVTEGTLSSRVGTYARPYSFTAHEIPREWWPQNYQGSSHREVKFRRKVVRFLPSQGWTAGDDERHATLLEAVKKVEQGEHLLPWRNYMRQTRTNTYFLSFARFPPRLRAEWESLRSYKCEAINFTNSNRGSRWKATTAEMVLKTLESFLGFLTLPETEADLTRRGKGMKLEDLTLGLLISDQLLLGYCEFMRVRSQEQRYTGTVKTFVINVGSLLRPVTGWLWQCPDLLSRLPVVLQTQVQAAGGWQEACKKTRNNLLEDFKRLQKSDPTFDRPSRNPFTPILPLLEQEQPLAPVLAALRLHREHIESYRRLNTPINARQACMMRLHLLISLLVRLPLRRKHWSLMTWGEESSHLYRHPERGWRLSIPFAEFKNVSNTNIFPPNDPLQKVVIWFEEHASFRDLIPDLELYLESYRPHLMPGSGELLPGYFKDGSTGAWTPEALTRAITTWTEKYLAEGPNSYLNIKGVHSFGPHAFRDLLATQILKATGSYEMAADALLDSVEMVRKHYTRFMPEDRLRRVHNAIGSFYRDV